MEKKIKDSFSLKVFDKCNINSQFKKIEQPIENLTLHDETPEAFTLRLKIRPVLLSLEFFYAVSH